MAVKRQTRADQAIASANTFEAIAGELVEKKRKENKADRTISKTEWLLSLAYPEIGARPIKEITRCRRTGLVRICQAPPRDHWTGLPLRRRDWTADADPTGALKGAIPSPPANHRAAIIDLKGFGALLRAIGEYEGAPETLYAMQLLAVTFVRCGELRSAEWSEFEFDGAVWAIPGKKMKMRRPHRVPLASQSLTILGNLKDTTGPGRFLFPSARSADRPMSENTINAALMSGRRLATNQVRLTSDAVTGSYP